jgi:hypothetical protein
MKNKDGHEQELESLEGEVGHLFEVSAHALGDVQLSRIAARAAEVKPRNTWLPRLIGAGAVCTGLLLGVMVLNIERDRTMTQERVVAVQSVQTPMMPTVGADNTVKRMTSLGRDAKDVNGLTAGAGQRLDPDFGDFGNDVDEDEVQLAMGTYLDIAYEGDELDFDDWDGDTEGLTEEELLQVTKDLVRNGG